MQISIRCSVRRLLIEARGRRFGTGSIIDAIVIAADVFIHVEEPICVNIVTVEQSSCLIRRHEGIQSNDEFGPRNLSIRSLNTVHLRKDLLAGLLSESGCGQ